MYMCGVSMGAEGCTVQGAGRKRLQVAGCTVHGAGPATRTVAMLRMCSACARTRGAHLRAILLLEPGGDGKVPVVAAYARVARGIGRYREM